MRQRSMGCLLIGETKRMRALRTELYLQGIDTVSMLRGGNMLSAAMEGLQAARRRGSVGIVAEGELWAVALALAAQLCVERIVLITPADSAKKPENDMEKQIEALKRFARRNLFFCVSDVLVLEERTDKRIDLLFRRMCNSRVFRLPMADQRWTNCEFSPIEVAARFLSRGEFAFSLAK